MFAIIPARSGSKRIKNKNIKIFNKKPMIYWVIKKLKKNQAIKKIVVTSDNVKILKLAKKYGADILIKRPKKLAKDNSKVSSPVFVDMGLEGMKIEAAGKVNDGFGHHHILINQYYWPNGSVIPMSDSTLHYGKGETDATLELPPGDYIISLQFADGVHASYGEEMSSSIKIKVD